MFRKLWKFISPLLFLENNSNCFYYKRKTCNILFLFRNKYNWQQCAIYKKKRCCEMDLQICGKCDVIKKRFLFDKKQQKCAFLKLLVLFMTLFYTQLCISINKWKQACWNAGTHVSHRNQRVKNQFKEKAIFCLFNI